MGYLEGFVSPLGVTGGLSLWWNDKMEVNVLYFSKNLIHFEMKLRGETDWFTSSWVYDNPYRFEKGEFWMWITSVLEPKVCPWLCGGDLNEIL